MRSLGLTAQVWPEPSGERRTLVRGGAALLPPQSGWRPQPTAAATAVQVVFDVVHQARSPRDGRAWFPADDTVQPAPAALWGVDLPVPLPEALAPAARRCAAQIARTWWLSPLDHLRANQRLGHFLLDAVEALLAAMPDEAPDDPLLRAERYARAALAGGCTVADLAAAAGLSRTRFTALYERRRGRAPGAFLADLRLAAAMRLLADPALSVAAVARRVGYRKAAAFVRRFRSATGEHPARWR